MGTILMKVSTVVRKELCSSCGMRFCELSLTCMSNPLFVALLIVNLLTCPLRCLACETHAPLSAVSDCATCECCEEVPNSSPAPSPESDECRYKSCICDGAVVESPKELPDPGPALIWMLPLYLESRQHFGVTEIAALAEATHVGQILSGRTARIAYQSWLI